MEWHSSAQALCGRRIYPAGLSSWKKKLKENGSKAFGGGNELKEKKDKIAKPERPNAAQTGMCAFSQVRRNATGKLSCSHCFCSQYQSHRR